MVILETSEMLMNEASIQKAKKHKFKVMYFKKYYQNNKEKLKKYSKNYYAKNRNKINAKRRKQYA